MEALTTEERTRRIAAFLVKESGRGVVRVENLHLLAGGSSREVWSLDAWLGEGASATRLELVLRLDPPPAPGNAMAAIPRFAGEFALLSLAHRQGVPVPRVLWNTRDLSWLGVPFYVMERIEGETLPRRILRGESFAEARSRLPDQLARALARVHAIDPSAPELHELARPRSGESSYRAQLAVIRAGIERAPMPVPTLELACRWLEHNPPAAGPLCLVHGDFRLGNFVVGPEGLRSVLDWELAHLGDPCEDLAWLCTKTWRFGNVEAPVGGLGPREPFYEVYETAAGRGIDRATLRSWEILACARVSVVWIFQVLSYLSGLQPSVEQAAIGRRMAETDLDLLELLEQL